MRPAELDETLTALGRDRRRTSPTSPAATSGIYRHAMAAVDDIDFTGGGGRPVAQISSPSSMTSGRTTGDYLPDLVDKPGDALNDDDEKRKRG